MVSSVGVGRRKKESRAQRRARLGRRINQPAIAEILRYVDALPSEIGKEHKPRTIAQTPADAYRFRSEHPVAAGVGCHPTEARRNLARPDLEETAVSRQPQRMRFLVRFVPVEA